MHRSSRKNKSVELSIIFILAALMIIALACLLGNVASASARVDFPDLFAPDRAVPSSTPSAMTVYLTFDDGPSANTEKILDILKEKGAKATFFVTAQDGDNEFTRALYKRIIDEGHTIGLHSYTHDFKSIYSSCNAYLKDIDRLRALIEESAGYKPAITRFPGGSGTRHASRALIRSISEELHSRGYVCYDWNVASGDDGGKAKPAKTLFKNMYNGVIARGEAGSIVLCHDNPTPATTPEAVAMLIDKLMEQGYKFASL